MKSIPPSSGADAEEMIDISVFDSIVWTALSIAILTTTLRLFSRSYIVRAFGLDDGLILFAQPMAVGAAGLARWHINHISENSLNDVLSEITAAGPPGSLPEGPPGSPPGGPPSGILAEPPAGPPIPDDSELREFFDVLFRSAVLSDLVYLLTLPLIKCSVLALYHRIINFRKQHYILYVTAFFIVAQALINFFMTLFAVNPVSALWNISSVQENAIVFSHSKLQVANSAFQVVFDLVILALPIPLLLSLKLSKRNRAGLIFLYLLSFFSLTATIIRLESVVGFDSNIRQSLSLSERMPYSYWAMLEIMTAIMCANLPALPALHRFVKTKFRKSSASGRHSTFETDKSRKLSARQWLNKSAHSLFTKSRYGKDDSLSDASLSKDKKDSVKSSDVEVSSKPTCLCHSPLSVESCRNEKCGHFDDSGTTRITIDENEPSDTPSVMAGTAESDGKIHRTDAFTVSSSCIV